MDCRECGFENGEFVQHRCAKKQVHVTPVNDLEKHEEGIRCKCNPKLIEEINGTVVVHNSFDGRELIEGEDKRN